MNLSTLQYNAIKIYCAMITTLDAHRTPYDCECEQMMDQAIAAAHLFTNKLEEDSDAT